MKFFIGIDGGGTKTAFLCLDEDLNEVARCELSTVHFMQVSDERAIEILKEGVLKVSPTQASKDEIMIGIGLGGYGKNPVIRKRIEGVCSQAFDGYHYVIDSDAQIALMGALDGKEGILVIAGTGSIALANKEGQSYRSGGWGYLLGDEGSAYWIAKKLFACYCQENDGRLERTFLSDAVEKACDIQDPSELILWMNEHQDRTQVALFAKVVYDLACLNHKMALNIYEEAAWEISKLIGALSNLFEDDCNVSYIGGVWKASSYMLDPLRKYLDASFHLIEPIHDAVYGACLMAYESYKKRNKISNN